MEEQEKEKNIEYLFPPIDLLAIKQREKADIELLNKNALIIYQTLLKFGINVQISSIKVGARFTRYEIIPEVGVKVSKIINRKNEIRIATNATDVNIEFPVDGKSTIGIDIANKENSIVTLREIIESKEFIEFPSNLVCAIGQTISGENIIVDIEKMSNLLISGTTGSGKSVCLDCIIMSILYKAHPEDVKLILIDTKMVNMSIYNGIPHLMIPVVTDATKACAALNWTVTEMLNRYHKFEDISVRNLKEYNKSLEIEQKTLDGNSLVKLPQILIIIDDLYDMIIVESKETQEAIIRLTQLARPTGIHLIISTQRPSRDVVSGFIKTNILNRIAFSTVSAVDSKIILDETGAEKLLGNGDMLMKMQDASKAIRIQGAYISYEEISCVTDFLRVQNKNNNEKFEVIIEKGIIEYDNYFSEAGKFIIEKEKASIGMLQRVYKIGFNRAARIMDQLAQAGVVGLEEGTKPRKILMTMEEFEEYLEFEGIENIPNNVKVEEIEDNVVQKTSIENEVQNIEKIKKKETFLETVVEETHESIEKCIKEEMKDTVQLEKYKSSNFYSAMNIKQCKECGKIIADQDKKCPNCSCVILPSIMPNWAMFLLCLCIPPVGIYALWKHTYLLKDIKNKLTKILCSWTIFWLIFLMIFNNLIQKEQKNSNNDIVYEYDKQDNEEVQEETKDNKEIYSKKTKRKKNLKKEVTKKKEEQKKFIKQKKKFKKACEEIIYNDLDKKWIGKYVTKEILFDATERSEKNEYICGSTENYIEEISGFQKSYKVYDIFDCRFNKDFPMYSNDVIRIYGVITDVKMNYSNGLEYPIIDVYYVDYIREWRRSKKDSKTINELMRERTEK